MGNTASSQHGQPDDGQVEELRHARPNSVIRDRETSSEDTNLRAGRRAPGSLRAAGQRASILYDTFRRHRQTDLANSRTSAGNTSPPPEEIEYEQENRPLVNSSDIDMPDAASSQSVSQTSSRRRIAMSRLGSRLLPDSVARGLLNSGEETEEEGHALRYGSSDRSRPSVYERSPHSESDTRLSLADSVSRRPDVRTESRRRPVRGAFPLLHNGHQPLEPTRSSANLFDTARDMSMTGTTSLRHRNRFSRVRDSISISARLSGLFGHSPEPPEAGQSRR